MPEVINNMENNHAKQSKGSSFFADLTRNQLFIPMAALLLLLVFNLIMDPGFFKITLGYNSAGHPVLSGFLITILDYRSEEHTSELQSQR